MQVILLEQAPNLGKLGDTVTVKDGYARNYLLPRKVARRATAAALKDFESRRAELESAAAEKLSSAQAAAARLANLSVSLTHRAGVDGRLFGSVTNQDIAAELTRLGVPVAKQQLSVPAGLIKAIGPHTALVALHPDVVVEVAVTVVGEPD